MLNTPASAEQVQLPLSGVRGFGIDTPGGAGGEIVKVTNLNESGPGSLREAVAGKNPRIVVFEVGGIIDLKKSMMLIEHPFLTIAGQTAPAPGITLIRGGIVIRTHDVRIQHMRVRPGDAGEAIKSGWEPDGITAITGKAYNVHIDHCSISWAVDENVSASGHRLQGPAGAAHAVTFSNSIIAEGLDYASHKKGRHSKGALAHDYARDIAFIGNLFAHNDRRNPYFKASSTGAVVNNLIYNPGSAALEVGYVEEELKDSKFPIANPRLSVVGNVLIYGRDTYTDLSLLSCQGDAYLEDNLVFNADSRPMVITQGAINKLASKPVWPEGLKPIAAKDLPEYIMRHAGARPKERDAVDRRIIDDFTKRTGRIIDSQQQVGGYPVAAEVRRPLDVPDKDNIQEWLDKLAAELE
jgi:pectate lyase